MKNPIYTYRLYLTLATLVILAMATGMYTVLLVLVMNFETVQVKELVFHHANKVFEGWMFALGLGLGAMIFVWLTGDVMKNTSEDGHDE